MSKKLSIATLSTLFLVGLLWVSQARALTLTPTYREITLTPGQKTATTVELKNETQKNISLTTEVAIFTAKGETGEPQFDFTAQPTDMATWIDVNKGPITLIPGQKQSIDVVFNTPADALPGGHYAAVFFNEVVTPAQPTQVNIESKLGTLFLATVKGSYEENGTIIAFGLQNEKNIYTAGPVDFTLRYRNTGDIHLKPTGQITIKNMFGKVIKTIPVNEDAGAVLPNSVRQFAVTNGWKNIGNSFGRYTATVSLTAGSVKSSASVSFAVLTTTGIIIFAAVIIILIVLAILLSRKHKKTGELKV